MPFIARGRIIVSILTVLWICLTTWFEYLRFSHDVNQCPWPDDAFSPSDGLRPHHVLIIADPQVLDHRSYPDRGEFVSWLSRFVVNINMRKNWWAAKSKKPDSVIFLGDMLDGGRFDMSDAEYEKYVQRFNRIFKLDPSIPKYYIPGNHDTGLGLVDWFSPERHARYQSHFGELNYEVKVANHSLVFIDAPGLAEEEFKAIKSVGQKLDDWIPLPGGTLEFITKKFKNGEDPVVLLTHIPLYRPDGNGCGRLRERGRIHPGGGLGYQNTLGRDATDKLLDILRPSLILSGDDHDYCEYGHFVSDAPNIKEVSVKSFSMAMGIKRPGFQLLSLAPTELRSPSNEYKPNADTPCFLPDQIGIYLRIYLPVFVFTIALVLMTNLCCLRSSRRRHRLTRSGSRVSRRSPEPEGNLPSPVSAKSEKTSTNVSSRKNSTWPSLFFCFYPRKSRMQGACLNCLLDIRDIAFYPLFIFLVVNYWFS